MKRSHVFEADDGRTFSTAEECRAHEERALFGLLCSLGMADIQGALDRSNPSLANAFEFVGNIVAAARRESGELKRARSKTAEALADHTGEKAGKLLAEKLDKRHKESAATPV